MFTDCQSSCGIIGLSINAFCHNRKRITYALSRDVNDVRKCFSESVLMRIAFGITLATFSLPLRMIRAVGEDGKVGQDYH